MTDFSQLQQLHLRAHKFYNWKFDVNHAIMQLAVQDAGQISP